MRSSGSCGGEVMTMEVPLAWQDPVPLTCFSGMEGESEDVPPSPTPDPITPTLAAGTFFQRGFLDCAEEALRFLTEEEGMSEDNPVVVGLRQHLVHTTPYFTRTTSARSVSTHPSEQGRFSPYTVPSYRSLAVGCPRRGADKHVTSVLSERGSMQHRRSASGVPSARRMEHVLTDELISSDDLQGVLRCLGSGQSLGDPSQNQRLLEPHLSLTPSSPTLHQSPAYVEAGVNGEEKRVGLQSSSSLDDSGVSEASSTDLADEVDGMDSLCFTTTASVCDTDTTSATSIHSVSVSVLDSAEVGATVGSGDSVYSQRCVAADKLAHDILPTNNELSSPNQSHSVSLASTVPASVSVSGSLTSTTASTASPLSSSPSSQLTLLSSLSSGTHRLTSSTMAMGAATASRIQSLASQILLLLQEEADSQDYSDEESDDDDEDDHVSVGDLDVEDDLWDVEAEP